MRHAGTAAAAGLGLVFAALTIPFALWPAPPSIVGGIGFALYVLLAAGLAVDVVETACALVWTPTPPRLACGPVVRERTAVLFTACDDAQPHALAALTPLSRAGFDVFVLDDSRSPVVLAPDLAAVVRHVVRYGRAGAKAGNLNHWLWRHSAAYDFAFVLDADSILPPAAADASLRAAAHADHQDVAIFQSKIASRTVGASAFARAVGAMARPRSRIVERVHARLGLLLSSGHNQLLRLDAVRGVGGFREEYAAEDTALSLDLARMGWRVTLVDAWSLDCEPGTVATYNRRRVRWARQTVELFRGDWRGAPTRLKLLLCRHLLSFVLPPAGFLLLAMSLWLGPRNVREVIGFMRDAMTLSPGYAFYGAALWLVFGIYAINGMLRAIVAHSEGIGWRRIALASAAACAAYPGLLLPLTASMLAAALGRRTPFVPTNSRYAVAGDASAGKRIASCAGVSCLLVTLLIGAWRHPGSTLVGFNVVWLVLLAASPLAALTFAWSDRRMPSSEGRGTVRP